MANIIISFRIICGILLLFIPALLISARKLVCQCCGMPIYHTSINQEPDGTFNEEYCKWCYTEGKFTYTSMDKLIDFCVKHMSNENYPPEQFPFI